MQGLLIILFFLSAVIYLIRLVYRHFKSKKACTNGCGACSTIDIQKIQSQIQSEG